MASTTLSSQPAKPEQTLFFSKLFSERRSELIRLARLHRRMARLFLLTRSAGAKFPAPVLLGGTCSPQNLRLSCCFWAAKNNIWGGFLSPAGDRNEAAEGNWLFVCSSSSRGNVGWMLILPFPACFPLYKVRGTIYLAAVSHSPQIGLVWNLTRLERRVKELWC